MPEIESVKKARVKITVSGRVQGVGFRYFIYHAAERLELTGYVKNLFNGDVEIEAEGRKEFLEELVRSAKTGPSGAHVKDIKVEWLEFKNKYDNFDIL
jgi:acylphosphatase